MINWLYLHLRAIGHALGRLAGQPLGTLLSALVVGIALSLPGGGYLLLDNVSSLVRGVSGTPEISVFLAAEAGAQDVAAIEQRLKAEPALASYRFVPRDEGLRQLEAAGLGDVLGGLKSNPLPDAFVIAPRGENPAVFAELATRMQAWPKVAHVQLDSAWVERLHALLGLRQRAPDRARPVGQLLAALRLQATLLGRVERDFRAFLVTRRRQTWAASY